MTPHHPLGLPRQQVGLQTETLLLAIQLAILPATPFYFILIAIFQFFHRAKARTIPGFKRNQKDNPATHRVAVQLRTLLPILLPARPRTRPPTTRQALRPTATPTTLPSGRPTQFFSFHQRHPSNIILHWHQDSYESLRSDPFPSPFPRHSC